MIFVLLINFILHQACDILAYLLVHCEINKTIESILGTTWLGLKNQKPFAQKKPNKMIKTTLCNRKLRNMKT